MEVRPGYKQTEVGVIPEDWTVKQLRQCLRGMPTYGLNAAGIPFDYRLATYLRITDITEDGRFADATKVSVNNPAAVSYLLTPGDIVFARTGASVGKSYLYNPNDGSLVFAGFLIRVRPDPEYLVPQYLRFYAQGSSYWNWIKTNSTRSGQPGINGREYASLPIPLPPTTAEQEAIAGALGDADALIEVLGQLLAKKRQLKQGAMQELLTGKKRLPGFSKKWELKQLGDCFALVTTRNTELNDNVVTISAQRGFVRQEEFFKKRVASSVLENYYLMQSGQFAYNRSYSNGYPFGAIKRLTRYDKGVVTTLYICFALKPEADSDPTFFEHYFEAGLLNDSLSTVTNEGGRAHGLLNITKADFLSREIMRPSLPEQTAIAAILSDMDAEIAALEANLAKARHLKQGMMQELLTGRIRLV